MHKWCGQNSMAECREPEVAISTSTCITERGCQEVNHATRILLVAVHGRWKPDRLLYEKPSETQRIIEEELTWTSFVNGPMRSAERSSRGIWFLAFGSIAYQMLWTPEASQLGAWLTAKLPSRSLEKNRSCPSWFGLYPYGGWIRASIIILSHLSVWTSRHLIGPYTSLKLLSVV